MPDILTSSDYDTFLSDDVQSQSDIDLRVDRAEWAVVDRYRAHEEDDSLLRSDAFEPQPVMLEGWEEDADGNPDTSAMDDDLVQRLRAVIADVVEHTLAREDQKGVKSTSQGSRSVSYEDMASLPSYLFRPLRQYDMTEPVSGFW